MRVTPTRLFHYKRFNQEHLISLLSEGKLKLSRPDQFNDPWDCSVHYHVPTEPEGIERLIQHWKDINRNSHPEISEASRAVVAYGIKSNPNQLKECLIKTEEKGSSRCPRYPNMWYEDAVRWAREGIEWLLGDRRIDSPAGPKSRRKLPPGCGQEAHATRKTENQPPVQISSAAPIC